MDHPFTRENRIPRLSTGYAISENGSERQEYFPVRWNAKSVGLHMAWRVSIQERCHHDHLKGERECESQRKLEEGVEECRVAPDLLLFYADC